MTRVWSQRHRKNYITTVNSVALVRVRTIPTERPPPVGDTDIIKAYSCFMIGGFICIKHYSTSAISEYIFVTTRICWTQQE
jgi:hypothetical protein